MYGQKVNVDQQHPRSWSSIVLCVIWEQIFGDSKWRNLPKALYFRAEIYCISSVSWQCSGVRELLKGSLSILGRNVSPPKWSRYTIWP